MSLRRLTSWGQRRARLLGIDIRGSKHTEEGILRTLLSRTRPDVVLDVGANVGQYVRLLRMIGYGGRVISFEALATAHARLCQAARDDSLWTVAPCAALGSHAGSLQLNVAANSASSSLLPDTALLRAAAPQAAYVERQTVDGVRLDTCGQVPATGNIYLKVDTQGYELEVLRGASGLLPRISAMQLELSLVPLYEGAPVLTDVIRFLDELGFDLFHIVPGFRDQRDGRLLQAEGFFLQRPPRPH